MSDPWHDYEPRPGLTMRVRLSPNAKGLPIVTGLTLEADALTGADLRDLSLRKLEAAGAPDGPPLPERPLTRPSGLDPAEHRKLVAEHYRHYSAISAKPGALMAEACGVPVPTVHAWIREARLRGFLPPARRGKAG